MKKTPKPRDYQAEWRRRTGQRLKRQRLKCGFSCQQIRLATGISGHELSKLERGHRTQLTYNDLSLVCEVIGMSLEDLLKEEE